MTYLACIGFTTILNAQATYEDSARFESTIEWLEDKLTYNYYNETDDEWWINRFTFNDHSETVTIKNINSPEIEAVSDKTYLQLNFRLEELNPFTIQVQKNTSNAGRLVKGKVIRVGAYEKSIRRVKNGRMATNQSFIYISIPEFLEDSLENYSQNIAQKLEEAIKLSTKMYNRGVDQNVKVLSKMLYGQFTNESGTKWIIQKVFENSFEIKTYRENDLLELHYLTLGENLQVNTIKPDHSGYQNLQLQDDKNLTYSNSQQKIEFISWNEILWSEGGQNFLLIRDWSAEGLPTDE